jgi:uncharacterized RDD family membrane protein YckC
MNAPAACPRCRLAVINGIACPSCGLVQARDGSWLTLASPGKRLLGYIIPALLFFLLEFFVFIVFFSSVIDLGAAASGVGSIGASVGTYMFLSALILAAILGYGVWWLLVAGEGYSPAKKLLGIRVVNMDGSHATLGTMLLRSLVGKYLLAAIIPFYFVLDGLWLLWDRDRQCLHDKFAKTLVVNDAPEPAYAAQDWNRGQAPYVAPPAPPPAPVAGGNWDEPMRPIQPSPQYSAPRPMAAAPRQRGRAGSGSPAERLRQLESAHAAGKVTEEQYQYWKQRLRKEAGLDSRTRA